MNTKDLHEILALATKHVNNKCDMQSSAELCLSDARRLAAENRPTLARMWALRSLSYSVGVFHPDYKKMQSM